MWIRKLTDNQITLPEPISAEFKDVEYFEVSVVDDCIVLSPSWVSAPEGIWRKLEKLGIRESDVERAIVHARSSFDG